jgi:hypothetical protein
MIIIKVQGGIGNQLLQYSIGRLLETVYKKEVAYDLSFFSYNDKYTKRPYLLDKFKTRVRAASLEEIETTKYPRGVISKIEIILKKITNKLIFKSYNVGYDEHFLKMVEKRKSLYLEGFWQSYRYYEPIIQLLQKEIVLAEDNDKKFSLCTDKVLSCESVAVHIRRGDYVTAGPGLETLALDYYKHAVLEIKKHINNPHYYIFSDDVTWVKNTMSDLFLDVTYVKEYELTDYQEFCLMMYCKNAIIANSTFSWFAALLNKHGQKIVIYPNDWKNIHLKESSKDICPTTWLGI